MKQKIGCLLLYAILVACLSGPVCHAQDQANPSTEMRPVIILADVSGSMQEKLAVALVGENEAPEKKTLKKAEVVKELLLRMTAEIDDRAETAIFISRYTAGDKTLYRRLLEIGRRGADAAAERIGDEFVVDFPVFNNRSPLADMLRQFDEKELAFMAGKAILVLISDGRESFYDLEDDEKESRNPDRDADDAVRGPLTELDRLKAAYGDRLSVFTVYLEKDGEQKDEPREAALMARMAGSGGGKSYDGVHLLQDPDLMTQLCNLLCERN